MIRNLNTGLAIPWGMAFLIWEPQTRATVGREMLFPAFLQRNSIGQSFDIQGIGLVKIHVDGFLGAGREGDTKIVGEVDVV